MAVKSFSIRIEEEMLDKLSYVANYEGRSANSHVLVLIRENIKAFEEANGVPCSGRRTFYWYPAGGLYEKVVYNPHR